MIRTLKQRTLFTLAAPIIAATCGRVRDGSRGA